VVVVEVNGYMVKPGADLENTYLETLDLDLTAARIYT